MGKLSMRTLLIAAMLSAGIIPAVISTIIFQLNASEALSARAIEQLKSIRASNQGHVQDFIDKRREQTSAMAGNLMVIEAMREFAPAFDAMPAELGTDKDQLNRQRNKLRGFYTGSFAPRYEEINDSAINATSLMPADASSVAAQYTYIADSPFPLGQKDGLSSADNGTTYDTLHQRFHPVFADYLKRFGYYDIFLVEPENGTVVYSVFKELDYGTSLFNGPYSDSNFTTAVRKAKMLSKGQNVLADFEPYAPSYNSAAAFIASPIFDGETLVGVLVFQMPVGGLNSIMANSVGLGETGQVYLVGQDGLYRSQARFSETDTIMKAQFSGNLDEWGAEEGVTGAYRHQETDYLMSSANLNTEGLSWTIFAMISRDEALSAITALRMTGLFICLITASIVALFAYLLGRKFHARLGADPTEIEQVAKQIGEGNLAHQTLKEEPVGAYAALINMRKKLSETLSQANRIATDVQSGSKDLAEGNLGLSERTEQQAANLEETASSTEELTSTVRQNAENARSANELAQTTSARASSSGEVAGKAVAAMQEISAASEEISEIIGVINEIAFQTNLLALNAAVEAARAGEQGRGFAVVASEVRQLAGRSASAAKEIKELIENSVSKVKGGTELVQESGRELEHIVDSVGRLSQIVSEISSASDEQAVGIDQINQALIHMDSVTQQNAALVEEAAATSKFMSDQANELAGHIGYFTVDQHGAATTITNQPSQSEPPVVQPVARNWQAEKSNTPPAPPQEHPAKPQVAAGSGEVWEDF
ncbi:MAG: methyl-accepting chemotaxis protein [Lysobacterales bacterium]